MTEQELIKILLDEDWNLQRLERAAYLLEQLGETPGAAEAFADIDRIREVLSLDDEAGNGLDSHTWIRPLNKGASSGGWLGRFGLSRGMLAAALLMIAATGWVVALWPATRGTGGGGVLITQPSEFEPNPIEPVDTPRYDASLVALSGNAVADQLALYRSVSEVFDDRVEWVATSDGNADLGIADRLLPAVDDLSPRLVMVRLVLSREGDRIADTTVAVVSGQSADVELAIDDAKKIRYRIAATDQQPTELALHAEILLSNGIQRTLAGVTTSLVPTPGGATPAGRMVTTDGVYELDLGFAEEVLTTAEGKQ